MNHIADNEEYTAGMTSYDHDPYDPFRQAFLCFFFDKRTEFDSGFLENPFGSVVDGITFLVNDLFDSRVDDHFAQSRHGLNVV